MPKQNSTTTPGRKRIVDLEVDENSLVDKPAIGETFFVIKSQRGGKFMSLTKEILQKANGWSQKTEKAVDHTSKSCLFCKEDGGREPKIGLLCSVCFSCATERTEKGVFDQCIDGNFDFEEYKKKFPDEFVVKTEATEAEIKATGGKPKNNPDDEDEDESRDEEDEESGDDEKDDKEQNNEDDEAEEVDSEKRLQAVEKQLDEVVGMLEESLSLHDSAAATLNQIVMLTTMALEQMMLFSEGQVATDEGDAGVQASANLESLMSKVKNVKEEMGKEAVSKIGAKISASRMAVLQDISEKLSELLRSIVDGNKAQNKSKVSRSLESLTTKVSSLESSFSALRAEATDKATKLTKRLDDLENTAGASGSIDDGDDDTGERDSKQKSLFSDVIGIDQIRDGIKKREVFLKKK